MKISVARKIVMRVLMKKGYSGYMADVLVKGFMDDLYKTKISLKKRLWAYRRGFFARRINEYGLNESNYKDYESDFHFYKLHPLNKYSIWIDDKLTYKYILQPFSDYTPKYYFELRKGSIVKLMDCPSKFTADMESVVNLLQQEKQLAVKPLAGTGGQGFYKVSVNIDKYSVNYMQMNIDELGKFLASLDRFIVTEYVISHEAIRRIYKGSPNTLRVIAVHNENEEPIIVGAYYRFGNSSTGVVDNIDAGGIACGVDIFKGILHSPKLHIGSEWLDAPVHPDTKIRIEGKVPHWELILQIVVDICKYLPQLKYMSFDIIITENGFKIIEINSHGAIYVMQMYFPLLKNRHIYRLFRMNK
jgi:hypothetical protein